MSGQRPTYTTVEYENETSEGVREERIRVGQTARDGPSEHPEWLNWTCFLIQWTIRAGLLCASWYLWLAAMSLFGGAGLAAGWLGSSAALWLLEVIQGDHYLGPERLVALILTTAVYYAMASLAVFALPPWLFWALVFAAGLTPTWRLYA